MKVPAYLSHYSVAGLEFPPDPAAPAARSGGIGTGSAGALPGGAALRPHPSALTRCWLRKKNQTKKSQKTNPPAGT